MDLRWTNIDGSSEVVVRVVVVVGSADRNVESEQRVKCRPCSRHRWRHTRRVRTGEEPIESVIPRGAEIVRRTVVDAHHAVAAQRLEHSRRRARVSAVIWAEILIPQAEVAVSQLVRQQPGVTQYRSVVGSNSNSLANSSSVFPLDRHARTRSAHFSCVVARRASMRRRRQPRKNASSCRGYIRPTFRTSAENRLAQLQGSKHTQ